MVMVIVFNAIFNNISVIQ